uniref:Large ribosomal subunit protein uL2 C-terminal domain-containing protein n=1 Tax=Kalanchoe fedtschenkoi TaxID=63787 RepID=A0A7N0ZXH9_KALFE
MVETVKENEGDARVGRAVSGCYGVGGLLCWTGLRLSTTVGQVRNVGVNQKSLGRVGSKYWLGKRLIVRGVVMNPVDNPHGMVKTPIGRKRPTTFCSYPALERC